MMFESSWLRKFGFHADPYSCPHAESLDENMIRDLFVPKVFEPKYLDPALNILNYPGSTVIYGWGKTMALHWLIWWAAQARMRHDPDFFPMVIPYTHFSPLLQDISSLKLAHHISPFLTAFVKAFLQLLSEETVGDIFMSLSPVYRQNWWGFLNQYLPMQWDRMSYLGYLPEPLLKDYHQAGSDRLSLDGEFDQILSQLITWLAALGINRTYIAIDNVTGYTETKDENNAASLITPIVGNDQLFHIRGLYWKIFLSERIKNRLSSKVGQKPTRYREYPIMWTASNLIEMVNGTLQACSDSGDMLNVLYSEDLNQENPPVEEQLATLALKDIGSPPKNMLGYVKELLQMASDGEGAGGLIDQNIWFTFRHKIETQIEQRRIAEQETGTMRPSTRQNYAEKRKQDLEERLDQLRETLAETQQYLDSAAFPIERNRLKIEIAKIKENIEETLNELDDVEYIAYYPTNLQIWVSKVYETLERPDLEDVKAVLASLETLPEEELIPLITAVECAQIPAEPTVTKRAKLVEEGQKAINQTDGAYKTKLKISIPVIPLLLSFETEVGLDGKLNLRALWNRITGRAKSN